MTMYITLMVHCPHDMALTPLIAVILSYCRNVTDADVLNQERKLNQTMDMILSKKKRSGGQNNCAQTFFFWCTTGRGGGRAASGTSLGEAAAGAMHGWASKDIST